MIWKVLRKLYFIINDFKRCQCTDMGTLAPQLRLAIALSNSDFSNINFDKKEIIARADKRLREIDEYYKTTIVNMTKYNSVLLTTSMITELDKEEQNKVVMFLINSI